jgi:hypothetical protein
MWMCGCIHTVSWCSRRVKRHPHRKHSEEGSTHPFVAVGTLERVVTQPPVVVIHPAKTTATRAVLLVPLMAPILPWKDRQSTEHRCTAHASTLTGSAQQCAALGHSAAPKLHSVGTRGSIFARLDTHAFTDATQSVVGSGVHSILSVRIARVEDEDQDLLPARLFQI